MENKIHITQTQNIEYRILNMKWIYSIFNIRYSNFNPRGFSLLELLIVIAILAVLGAAGAGSYRSFGKSVQIDSIARTMSSDLRSVQSKAMIGESGLKWGIHFVNSTNDYYEIFSTPDTYANASTTGRATTTLPINISFSDPSSGNFKDVIFNKISGITTATSTTIVSENVSKTISVSAIGTIGE